MGQKGQQFGHDPVGVETQYPATQGATAVGIGGFVYSGPMLIRVIPAIAFGTNCYVVAPSAGEECLIVDPGIGVADRVHEVLESEGLTPAGILLTHGHLDHVYDVPTLGLAGSVTTGIHPQDRYRLINPLGDVDSSFVAMLEAQFKSKATWREPEAIVEFAAASPGDGVNGPGAMATLTVAGLQIGVTHAPGHTEGSVLFELSGIPDNANQAEGPTLDRTVLSGDVLFAGSIGRTDLAGGDPAAMQRSLRDVVLPLPDTALVLPGHGPATTMGAERTANPYLQLPLA